MSHASFARLHDEINMNYSSSTPVKIALSTLAFSFFAVFSSVDQLDSGLGKLEVLVPSVVVIIGGFQPFYT